MKHLFRFAGLLALLCTILGAGAYIVVLMPGVIEEDILLNTVIFWAGFGMIVFFGIMLSFLFVSYGSHLFNHWSKDYGTGVVLDDIKTENEIIKRGTLVKVINKDRKRVQIVRDLTVCVIEKKHIIILSKKKKSVVFNVDLKAGDNLIPAGTIGQMTQELGDDKIKVLVGDQNIVVARSSVTIK